MKTLADSFFQQAFEAARQPSLITDRALNIVKANAEAGRFFECNHGSLPGNQLCELMDCRDEAGIARRAPECSNYRNIERNSGGCCSDLRMHRLEGNPVVSNLDLAPLVDANGLVGFVCSIAEFRAMVLPDRESHADVLLKLTRLSLDDKISLQAFLQLAMEEAARVLHVDFAKVLEIVPGEKALHLRAGIGWSEGMVGSATVPFGTESQAGYTLRTLKPVVVENLDNEMRFHGPALLLEHQVKSGISVIIGTVEEPLGVLGLHARTERAFKEDEIGFVTAIANLITLVIRRQLQQQELSYSNLALQKANEQLRMDLIQQTEQGKKLEEYVAALRKAEQLLENQQFALDQHSIVAITDQTGRITYVNDKFCEISLYSREELLGQNHRILKSGCHEDGFFENMWLTIAHGEVWKGEIKNRNKHGGHYWVETTIVPCLNAKGKPYQYVSIRTDITQRKLNEAELEKARDLALEASRAKSEFLATMSHEIRTPMNGIIGMAEILSESGLRQEQQVSTQIILESANALLTIINDILDFSKIESGYMRLAEEDFNLGDIVESVAELLAPQARQKKLSLLVRIDSEVPEALFGDAGRLRQVLLNLAGNAIKFTHSGDVLLEVGLVDMQDGCVILQFNVIDTGIGIPADKTSRLFHPFMQADSSTTRKYGGTGLGLSICKSLVEMMGGEIGVMSTQDVGSTFWVKLPFRPADPVPKPRNEFASELAGSHVLVVDNSKTNRDVLEHYLHAWGSECASVEGGQQALAAMLAAEAEGIPFDLVLIDFLMPEMNGFDLARRIAEEPRLRGTRLVLLTASDQAGLESEAFQYGFNAYFNKPVKRKHLLEGLRKVLQNSKDTQLPSLAKNMLESAVGIGAAREHVVLQPGVKPVLLVEDNPVNQLVASRQLEKLGYVVRLAVDGHQAVELMRQEAFAAVLMDCHMPGMDGYEAVRAIRSWENESRLSRTVIIALTANASSGDYDRCLAVGMDDYLSKPLGMPALQQMLAKWNIEPAIIEHHAGAASKRFDKKVLTKLHEEIGDSVHEVIESYLATTPQLLESLRQSVLNGDPEHELLCVHSIKSSSLQLGLVKLGEIAGHMEMRIRISGHSIEIGDVEHLVEEYQLVVDGISGVSPVEKSSKQQKGNRSGSVLVVDDDATMRLMLSRAMEEEGYLVEEASNGMEALSKCETFNPQIVLMDCMMPLMSGFDTCRILQQYNDAERPSVLMITGLNDEGSVSRSIECGAADFITKPLYIPILRQRVRQLLEWRQAQEHIRHLAFHDALTGLPNRLLFNDRLQLAIASARRNKQRLAVFFLDLDNFKKVNDSLGHGAGDMLLKSVAERISSILRQDDTLSRMGGDEFTILIPYLPPGEEGTAGIKVLADKIIRNLNSPVVLDKQEIYIGTSIGVSIYPDDSIDASGLLKHADTAMYWAKGSGKNNYCLYSMAMHDKSATQLQLESGLRKALERNELVLFYQPQVNAASNAVEGMEALLRWNHPELGFVPPDQFIPVAEEIGSIVEIGAWVIEMACKECMAWHGKGHHALTIAVNLSARQFRNGNLLEVVKGALERSGLPPHRLDLEITESITMDASHGALETLLQLKALGVQISMDDFGTGYSSLSYLKRFPIDVLKIDKSFVQDVMGDASDAAIVVTIIAMAKTLGMRVIAEGVETSEQLKFLSENGCDQIQGYLVSPPCPADKFEEFLLRYGGLSGSTTLH